MDKSRNIISLRIEIRGVGDQLQATVSEDGHDVLLGSIGQPLLDGNDALLERWKALITDAFASFVTRNSNAEVVAVHEVPAGQRPS